MTNKGSAGDLKSMGDGKGGAGGPAPKSDTSNLQKLGSETKYTYTGADAALLERFPNPMKGSNGLGQVLIKQPEFTSLCPMTGQPDFATMVIVYEPKEWCVESKSLKLYLGSFRQVGEFHEACVAKIHHDLMMLLDPRTLLVRGEFTPRGGIPFWPEVKYPR